MSDVTTIGRLTFEHDGNGCHVRKDGCSIGYIHPSGDYNTDVVELDDIDAIVQMMKAVIAEQKIVKEQ